ncbi:polysaccharide deacetylase family protein [Enterococcus timonensis]|uniref:polysaccharide deacetylase family protein n=1 Tax=Enterococcus timonensis TaxID=1852364 RepID=UPI0008DAD9CF|nr:polysaccharide deacetylase family protein [Enterococcus timonensis]
MNAYLTVDDGPNNVMDEMLDYFVQEKIITIFFVIGQRIEQQEKILLKALQQGFILGNHSFSHPVFSQITLKQAILEIELTEELLNRLYQKAGKERPAKLFRFPYFDQGGENAVELEKCLKYHGFVNLAQTAQQATNITCDFDFQEYLIPQQQKKYSEIIQRVREKDFSTHNSNEQRQIIL